jgi:Na+/H+-dicarboxylate symporter
MSPGIAGHSELKNVGRVALKTLVFFEVVILMAVASDFRIPAAAVLMLLGVDTLMDMGRTAMNVIGIAWQRR